MTATKRQGEATPEFISHETTAELAIKCFADLRALFKAIEALAPDKPAIQSLTRIGCYLVDDWSNLVDCHADEVAK